MKPCAIQDAGTIELYFYDELDRLERLDVERHVLTCGDCADALAELRLIRDALAARPDVSAPPSGDWGAFMARLDDRLAAEATTPAVVPFTPRPAPVRASWSSLLATAALVAFVAMGVFVASQAGREALSVAPTSPSSAMADARPAGDEREASPVQMGLASVGLHHLERSKLVVLGLATREGYDSPADEWAYERELATALLNDTRLYRMAAEERGLTSLASVMKDLELVLLQASMAEASDTDALPQIQRLIRKRGLVEKMEVVRTSGLLP